MEAEGVTVDRSARPDIDFDVVRRIGIPLISAATSPGRTDEEFSRLTALLSDPDADPTLAMRAFGTAMTHRDWMLLDEQRQLVRAAWADFFELHDVVICPVSVIPAFPHQTEGNLYTRSIDVDGAERPYADLIYWTSLIGMAYLPSTVVPVGLTPEGLPVGVQVVGPYLEDRTAFSAARLVEDVTGGYQVPPLASS
jgi:amidase